LASAATSTIDKTSTPKKVEVISVQTKKFHLNKASEISLALFTMYDDHMFAMLGLNSFNIAAFAGCGRCAGAIFFESSPLRVGSSTRQNNSAFTTFETN